MKRGVAAGLRSDQTKTTKNSSMFKRRNMDGCQKGQREQNLKSGPSRC